MFATKTREHDKIVLEQGIAQGLMDSVKRLKRKGFSASEISELLEIPIKEVEEAVKLQSCYYYFSLCFKDKGVYPYRETDGLRINIPNIEMK